MMSPLRTSLLLPALLLTAPWVPAQGNDLVMTLTGQLETSPTEVDVLGLGGASFTWTGSFDADAPAVPLGPNLDEFAGDLSLTLTGRRPVLTPGFDTLGEVSGATVDQYQLSNAATFAIGANTLTVGAIRVPAGFTGAVSPTNTLTPVQLSDVLGFDTWSARPPIVVGQPFTAAQYAVVDPQLSTTDAFSHWRLEYSGTLVLTSSTTTPADLVGLDGVGFRWQGKFVKSATPSFTNGVNLDRFSGTIRLVLDQPSGETLVLGPLLPQVLPPTLTEYNAFFNGIDAPNLFPIDAHVLKWNGLRVGFPLGVGLPGNTLDPLDTADVQLMGDFEARLGVTLASYYVPTDWTLSSVVQPSVWSDLGCSLPGTSGAPLLKASGTLDADMPFALRLSEAAPDASCALFAALGSTPVPFKGGTLCAFPYADLFLLNTNGVGELNLHWTSFPSGLSGLSLVVQYAVIDPGAVAGVALSNAQRGEVP